MFNVSARKHGAMGLPVPDKEKMPKVILKELVIEKRPVKIGQKQPKPEKCKTLEQVLAE